MNVPNKQTKNICVTVSGGETSAFKALLLRDKLDSSYNLKFVFANTGQENEETLDFVYHLETYYDLPIVWVEAVVHHNERKASTHKVVNYYTASRLGYPFEEVVKKYGLPNKHFLHCTRELKENPIKSYFRNIGWGKPPEYIRSIGIRSDEMDRISPSYKVNGLYYPLAFDFPTTKPEINTFWSKEPRRLNLKAWEGNCKWCYKKSFAKHSRLIKDTPEIYDFPRKLEARYSHVKPKEGESVRKMFRMPSGYEDTRGLTVDELFDYCKNIIPVSVDQNQIFVEEEEYGCQESCEAFS